MGNRRWVGAAVFMACIAGVVSDDAHADRVYVSNEDGQSVTVFDTQRGAVVATVEVGKRPRGMKLNADGSRLFVAVSGLPKCPPTTPDEECAKMERDLKADGVAVIDTAANKLLKVLEAGSDPEQFAISPDDKRLYVANEDSAQTSVVDVASGAVVKRIPVGREPEGVVMAPNGKWVLVTNESDNSVSIIDTQSLTVLRSVVVGKRPRDMAFTPDSGAAYVSGEMDASLYRISVPGGSVQKVLELRKDARPMAVLLDPKRNRLYLSTGRGGTVAVIDVDPARNVLKLVKEIAVGARPWGMAMSADGRFLYTANGPSNDMSIVDTDKLETVKRVPMGKSPWGAIIGPAPPAAK